MFFVLSRKVGKIHRQLGIVVADSVEEAAQKIEMEILSDARPPDAPVVWAWLLGEFFLQEMLEIASPNSIPKMITSLLSKPPHKKAEQIHSCVPPNPKEFREDWFRLPDIMAREEGDG